MKYKKTLFSGIAILIISILVGTIGTLLGISNSFDSMRTNETAGIGAVGLGIERALISTIIGIIGATSVWDSSLIASVKLKPTNSFTISRNFINAKRN